MLGFLRNKASFDKLGLVADCHCHVLPAVDDGVRSDEEAVSVLSEMIGMGIKSAVLTPHINPEVYPDTDESVIRRRYKEFTTMLPREISSNIQISLGAEYMVTRGFEKRDTSGLVQFRPGKVLIEMSYLLPSENIEQAVFNIIMNGLTPVVAHPERYLYYAEQKERFERLHDMGAEFQMNAISLSGAYGPESLTILKFLLDRGWYSYIGTDTHNTGTLERIRQMRFDRSLLDKCIAICSPTATSGTDRSE